MHTGRQRRIYEICGEAVILTGIHELLQNVVKSYLELLKYKHGIGNKFLYRVFLCVFLRKSRHCKFTKNTLYYDIIEKNNKVGNHLNYQEVQDEYNKKKRKTKEIYRTISDSSSFDERFSGSGVRIWSAGGGKFV